MRVEKSDLISGEDIQVAMCHVRQIKLRDIKGSSMYKIYNKMIGTLSIGLNDIISADRAAELRSEVGDAAVNVLDLMLLIPALQRDLIDALTFFLRERVVCDEVHQTVLIFDQKECIGRLTPEIYEDICSVVMQANYMSDESLSPKKFRSKKAQATYEKIQRLRPKKSNPNASFEIYNIISQVSAKSHTYNLLNIWDLTVYQLYDQFTSIRTNHIIDSSMLKWAAWGDESPDFDLWFKIKENNQ